MSTTLSWKDGALLVDAGWYAFCHALYKGIEGGDWEAMYDSYKVMSRAMGAKKPQEARKAKALWAMKSSQGQEGRVFMIRLAKRTFWEEINKRLELWEEHLKDPIVALDKAPKCVEDQYLSWLEAFWKQGSNDQR